MSNNTPEKIKLLLSAMASLSQAMDSLAITTQCITDLQVLGLEELSSPFVEGLEYLREMGEIAKQRALALIGDLTPEEESALATELTLLFGPFKEHDDKA